MPRYQYCVWYCHSARRYQTAVTPRVFGCGLPGGSSADKRTSIRLLPCLLAQEASPRRGQTSSMGGSEIRRPTCNLLRIFLLVLAPILYAAGQICSVAVASQCSGGNSLSNQRPLCQTLYPMTHGLANALECANHCFANGWGFLPSYRRRVGAAMDTTVDSPSAAFTLRPSLVSSSREDSRRVKK